MSSLCCVRSLVRAMSVVMTITVLTAFCMCSSSAAFADPQPCSGSLPPGGSATTDLLVNGPCTVDGTPGSVAVYVFHNVNIVAPGSLTFADTRIDFHAESIIVESGGKLAAGTIMHPIGMNPPIMGEVGARLRIYLWGASTDAGALCYGAQCGVPSKLWTSNTTLMTHTVPMPKDMACKKASSIDPKYKLPGDDCFYGYDSFDAADKGKAAYFGHKVLALSYGGTIQLLGMKGATYDVKVDGDPGDTGTSWVRLNGSLSKGATSLSLSRAVDWAAGDQIVVTTTDYMPTHSEQLTIVTVGSDKKSVTFTRNAGYPNVPCEGAGTGVCFPHNGQTYTLAGVPTGIGPTQDSHVTCSSGTPNNTRCIDTRAAVGLLTRSIEILSEGDEPDTDTSEHDHFPPTKDNYFGGHTIVRQGFTNYQIKGVEFYHLGQGGLIGHYPVHFHMARKTPQPTDPTLMPYVRDSSIHESMTRWITVHATQGMTIARNVGFVSIGHGYYLEDATEVNNKLYANLGVSVIAGVHSATLNPRDTPGILARPGDGPRGDFMPYRSDWNHPSAFWIMNGWNDFQYNMAAGVTSCGSCYWLLPGANGGPSMFETWDGYASQQLNVQDMSSLRMDNTGRSGLTPLKSFIGNSCVASQLSFTSIGDTYDCGGFSDGPANDTTLQAVTNTFAPPVTQSDTPTYRVYYPQITGLRNPSQCLGADDPKNPTDCSSGNTTVPPCANTGPNKSICEATVLDHYDTSFNYAQTNFAAIWMRPKWFLFTDGAVTDSQYAGLNFTTGGGYTQSDNPLGNWMLAYKTAFIGTSQTIGSDGFPANGYASEAGPFNPKTGLNCANQADRGYCLSTADAISIQVNPFPGQRLFSVYDGPAFQQSNAYLDVYPTLMPGSGTGWMYRTFFVDGVPKDASGTCYLPNAGIAWKQPNGFYYPPAFHSLNLMFRNDNIRHFLIEPLFVANTWPYIPNDDAIHKRYCPGNDSPGMFNNFTDIDRQTVLNDGVPDTKNKMGMNIPGGDGALTGLVASENSPTMTTGRETISVNEDPFFNAPLETVECASDKHDSIADGKGAPGTAKTSPYEYVTTGIIAGCAIGFYPGTRPCPPPNQGLQCSYPHECIQGDPLTGPAYWTHQGATPQTFGVPLYRQYLTAAELMESPPPKPRALMLGQDSGQRSTLTLNHGHYYIDTSNNCSSQGGCIVSNPASENGVSVFQGGQTYYVYFIYGKPSTQLTFDIYLGPNDETGKWKVAGVRGTFDTDTYVFNPVKGATPWLPTPVYDKDTNLLTVTVDLSKSSIATEFANEFSDACQPKSYCGVKVGKDGTRTCGCTIALGSSCKDDTVCSWGPKDPDCPNAGCYGFAFTMPSDWVAPPNPVDPPAAGKFSDDTYFDKGNVQFKTVDTSKFGQKTQCQYTTPPTQ